MLDVANPKSYVSGSDYWYDLAQGLTFASTGGTRTPLANVNGVPSFDFNGSGYWYCSTNSSLVDMGGDCTLIIWLFEENVTVRKTIFEKQGNSYASYEQEIAVTWETDERFSYYSRKFAGYDVGYVSAGTLGTWSMRALKMSSGKAVTARAGFRSVDGSNWVADYTSNSNTALVAAGAITIGTGYSGTCDVGNIGMVICYNKALNNSEIEQVYSATKTRFLK
jgi:hypothetical protein